MTKTTEVRCPCCNRFLAEVNGFGRARCGKCGSDVHFQCTSDSADVHATPREERTINGAYLTTINDPITVTGN